MNLEPEVANLYTCVGRIVTQRTWEAIPPSLIEWEVIDDNLKSYYMKLSTGSQQSCIHWFRVAVHTGASSIHPKDESLGIYIRYWIRFIAFLELLMMM
jgi:hypothetical protein